MLAGLERPDGRQRVPVIRRRDDDGVDVLVVEHAAEVLHEPRLERRHIGQPRVVDPLRNDVGVDVAERLDLDIRQLREAALERVALAADADAGEHDALVGAEDRGPRRPPPSFDPSSAAANGRADGRGADA